MWLRLRAFEENGLNICAGYEEVRVLLPKKSTGWADGAEVTSRRYYGRRKPNFRQQDGRVVKAPIPHP